MNQIKRLLSIDVFRSVNMFFMVFVNDLSGVRNVPAWIDHVKEHDDGLHFADTIFPIFLFIAGLSIPMAIGRRISKGDSFTSISSYILSRSFALIIMGFFHVNMEDYSDSALLPIGVWELLLTLAFFLIWLDYPDALSKTKKYILIGSGVAILIVLAFLFKGGSANKPQGLSPSWWGILGIIGWAYLICSGLFLVTKGKMQLLIISLLVFVAINLSVHGSLLDLKLWVINDGSSLTLMMFGVIVSMCYSQILANGNYKQLWLIFTFWGAALILLGFFIRPYTEGISKIHSTPAWVFICTGIGVLVFEILIWLIDVKGKPTWFKIIKPAGTSTLTSYLIPYFIASFFFIANFKYPRVLDEGIGGIIRSFAVAFIVILITGSLEKRRLRLKI